MWLDRVTGRVCMAISARGLAITGIEDRRYWNWIPTEESRLVFSIFFFYKFINIGFIRVLMVVDSVVFVSVEV